MAGGELGNFCDRLAYGSVTDFLALGETIVINPADVALLAGMVLIYAGDLAGGIGDSPEGGYRDLPSSNRELT